ncbi:hypothetical protein ROZALSC1DRAFT_30423 [Rozella allomycis CSF55]|uniref:Uncharacterized protein n=1 Tax=Rozella allomycis (strain CSF55) TaxID=988480 RepID=A0A075AVG3_ROZAC|nr:hypothetical protein O9G_003185 [Rozella allomycis CSF55]RKP17808.1 hypothetical protein ROZALSC1DRAFT_30423 [Rozella allomycis CSF55]|eukprot:EPZ34105.1 hypothetical protein O9G_003185 [Rozella allomycis CSF55]
MDHCFSFMTRSNGSIFPDIQIGKVVVGGGIPFYELYEPDDQNCEGIPKLRDLSLDYNEFTRVYREK